jgi:hypothetical protein
MTKLYLESKQKKVEKVCGFKRILMTKLRVYGFSWVGLGFYNDFKPVSSS